MRSSNMSVMNADAYELHLLNCNQSMNVSYNGISQTSVFHPVTFKKVILSTEQ